jgi:hypothetical protein
MQEIRRTPKVVLGLLDSQKPAGGFGYGRNKIFKERI